MQESRKDWSWSPGGFLFWSVTIALAVGLLSLLFVNFPLRLGLGVSEEVRAAYWGAAIGAGIGLAGALVAIVLARRSQDTSQEVLSLEQRSERRELDAMVRVEALGSAETLRLLGEAIVTFIASWAPVEKDVKPEIVRNWLLGATSPNQNANLGRLTWGYVPTPRDGELTLSASARLVDAIDNTLKSPVALSAASHACGQRESTGDNRSVRDRLIESRAYLVNNLRDFPKHEILAVSSLVSDVLVDKIRKVHFNSGVSAAVLEQRVEISSLIAFVGTLMARDIRKGHIKPVGIESIFELLHLIPDRNSLIHSLEEHFGDGGVDSANSATVRESISRVLDGGGVADSLLEQHSASVAICACVAAECAGAAVSLVDIPINKNTLEQVLAAALRLSAQADNKLALADVRNDKDLALEALADRYESRALTARFTGVEDVKAVRDSLWNDIWILGHRSHRNRPLAARAFRAMSNTAWLISQPIAHLDGRKTAKDMVEKASSEMLALSHDYDEALEALRRAPAEDALLARIAQRFSLVLEESPLTKRELEELVGDMEDEHMDGLEKRLENLRQLLFDVAVALHATLRLELQHA
ncbi:hypothetical protein RZA67_00975 [Stenotrophomonas sp. C3(2023)]|uniref:hypothetical protein n=1 Tax=Stenotrophomonas sp. C3(2023) TaxID=3080277 RepID=UPI00293C9F62|nr:hypothetical protein [Stenotrophomonas sp. C3(2023)]MDV3467310.1 hypothetical protein [Stenotrophomonas sp. C3(2023)]